MKSESLSLQYLNFQQICHAKDLELRFIKLFITDCYQFRAMLPRTLPTRTSIILWVSRLIPMKEPDVLIEALKILNE